MAKPKLALIPAAQGSKLFSVLPSSGVGDFTFTRSGKATRINSQGLIEEVSNGQSRLNYPMIDGKVVGCPHHILEPQRTNLVTYSELFTGWTLDDTTIVGNNTISPDGTLNATLLKGNTNSSRHHIQKGGWSLYENTSFSVFVKAKELKYVQIATAIDTSQYANFDVSIGVIGTVGSTFSNAKIEDYGNGWYRLSAVGTRSNGLYISLVSGLTASWLESWTMSNNTDGLYIWGGQSEIASYPTSYIKTLGSAVTRIAETATDSGDAATFNDSEGVLMAEISSDVKKGKTDDDIRSIYLSDGSDANRVVLRFMGSTLAENTVNFLIQSTGSSVQQQNITMPYNITNFNKYVIRWKNNEVTFFANGFEVGNQLTSFTTFTSGTLNDITFDRASGAEPFYGNTKQVQYYDSALTDSELEQLTSWTSFTEMAQAQQYSII